MVAVLPLDKRAALARMVRQRHYRVTIETHGGRAFVEDIVGEPDQARAKSEALDRFRARKPQAGRHRITHVREIIRGD